MTDTRIIQAIIYLRLSDLRKSDLKEGQDIEEYFKDRETKLRDFAERLSTDKVRWEIVRVVTENDVIAKLSKNGKMRSASAYRKRYIKQPDGSVIYRVWRPGFQSIIGDFWAGRANGLLAEDLDRVARDPEDINDLRNVAKAKKINARSLSGSLTFTDGGTSAERTMAGVMAEFAQKSSEDTARRVADERERQAIEGRFGGGKRHFGFDGVTVVANEARVIAECSRRVLLETDRGNGTVALAAELRDGIFKDGRGPLKVDTVTGVPWTSVLLRQILLRPHNAGIKVYRGEEIGRFDGEPIIPEDVFRAVVIKLNNNSNFGPGPAPKWQGSGTYLCGACNDGNTSVQVVNDKRNGEKVYRCRTAGKNHLKRKVRLVDAAVNEWIVDRFSQPDAIDMFATPTVKPGIDATALRTEKAALTENLKAMAVQKVKGEITPAEYRAAREYAVTRIAEIEQILTDAVAGESPVVELVTSEDVQATWDSMPLATRQQIIRAVAVVKILRSGRGRRDVNVSIEPVTWESEPVVLAA